MRGSRGEEDERNVGRTKGREGGQERDDNRTGGTREKEGWTR